MVRREIALGLNVEIIREIRRNGLCIIDSRIKQNEVALYNNNCE